MEAILEVSGARRRFGTTVALDGADLVLRRGEWLALLGPNGAGKTTLIRSIAGRVRLDDGSVRVLSGDGAARPALGIVPQDIALYPRLTAAENLRGFGRLHGVPAAELDERVASALEWTGLADRATSLVDGFSGGMKRRLNIACGVLHEPAVVLLDEPTVGVDPQSRERIWEMLSDLRKRGVSLLLTTHQLDEAQSVADRIVIIDHGRVIAEGTFDELLRQTIGPRRRVAISFEDEVPAALIGDGTPFAADDAQGAVTCAVDDVARELPELLATIDRHGGSIADVRIEAPSLQAVFIHLTGRELRE